MVCLFIGMEDKDILKVCSIADPAIDEEKSDLAAYEIDRDPKHLSFLDGQKPTWFFLRKLSTSQMALAQQNITTNETWFVLCLLRVQNMPLKDGTVAELLEPANVYSEHFKVFSFEQLESMDLLPPVVIEIGAVAYNQHFLAANEKRNYQAPPRLMRFIRNAKASK